MVEEASRGHAFREVYIALALAGEIAQDAEKKDSNSHSVIVTDWF